MALHTTEMRMLRCARGKTRLDHVRNVDSSLKSLYSKQPIIGPIQEFHWVGACVGGSCRNIKLSG